MHFYPTERAALFVTGAMLFAAAEFFVGIVTTGPAAAQNAAWGKDAVIVEAGLRTPKKEDVQKLIDGIKRALDGLPSPPSPPDPKVASKETLEERVKEIEAWIGRRELESAKEVHRLKEVLLRLQAIETQIALLHEAHQRWEDERQKRAAKRSILDGPSVLGGCSLADLVFGRQECQVKLPVTPAPFDGSELLRSISPN